MQRSQSLALCVGAALLFLMASVSSVLAFTCEDVRSLTSEQQNYYAKVFHVSAAQRHQIWLACYVNYHAKGLRIAHR